MRASKIRATSAVNKQPALPEMPSFITELDHFPLRAAASTPVTTSITMQATQARTSHPNQPHRAVRAARMAVIAALSALIFSIMSHLLRQTAEHDGQLLTCDRILRPGPVQKPGREGPLPGVLCPGVGGFRRNVARPAQSEKRLPSSLRVADRIRAVLPVPVVVLNHPVDGNAQPLHQQPDQTGRVGLRLGEIPIGIDTDLDADAGGIAGAGSSVTGVIGGLPDREMLEQLRTLFGELFREILSENNGILKNDISSTVAADVVHEIDFLLQAKERQQEEHFRKLDSLIRQQQNHRKESARSNAVVKLRKLFIPS